MAAVMVVSAGLVPRANAVVRYVVDDQDRILDSQSLWFNASEDLQAVINASSAGDEIWISTFGNGALSPGTGAADTFTLKPGVAIYGGFSSLDDEKSDRNDPPNSFSELTGGDVNDTVVTAIPGVGETGAYTLDQILISHGKNTNTTKAAGLHAETNQVFLNNCKFEYNDGGYYGAVYIKSSSTAPASISGCKFNYNSANIEEDNVTGSDAEGGGIYLEGDGELLRCEFNRNKALFGVGGGIRAKGGSVEIKNCLFYNSNKAKCTGGGGIYAGDGVEMEVRNCTFGENQAVDDDTDDGVNCAKGGGLYAVGSATSVDIDSSIFWKNEVQIDSPSVNPVYVLSDVETDGLATVTHDYSYSMAGWAGGTGNITVDPWSGYPAPSTLAWRIQNGSSAADAGDPNTTLDWALDLDNKTRVVNSRVDLGINELQLGMCCQGGGVCETVAEAVCDKFVCNVATLFGTTCFGDVDGSGVINASDRGFISGNIGATDYLPICQCDLDGNGVINASDRGFVSANIGLCTTLPDFQDGSGLNGGVDDSRFGSPVWLDGLSCEQESELCP